MAQTMAATLDQASADALLARRIFILAIVGGVALRLLSVTLGDLDPGGD